MLIFSLVLPTTPIIAGFATGGFALRQFPPTSCVTKSGALLYYTVILPLSVKTIIGISLLIIIIAELIKVTKTLLPAYFYVHNIHHLFNLQRRGIKERSMRPNTGANVGIAADKKILIVLCYYICFNFAFFANSSVNSNVNAELVSHVKKYFDCEANGYNWEQTCSAEKMAYEALSYSGVTMIFNILVGAFPAVTLIFIMRLNLKKSRLKYRKSISKKQTVMALN